MAADEFPLPYEYRFIQLEGLVTEPPDGPRASARSCSWTAATSTATPAEALRREDAHILNIDHHHDNTRFGTINHVVPEASCTAEIVWDLMQGLGVELTPAIAEALYVGLVTDTGRFMYENTGAARARDGRRADRRAGSTSTTSTGGSTRASRRASSSCSPAGSPTSSASTAGCSPSPT